MNDVLRGRGARWLGAIESSRLIPARWRDRPRAVRSALAIVLTVALTTLGGLVFVPSANADTCANPIVCENNKTGDPREDWDISGSGDAGLQGFATKMSVQAGEQIQFKIKTPATSYSIDIYRLGWYNGDGARKWGSATPSVTLPQTQPDCIESVDTQVYDCGNWAVSASWTVPSDAVSGVYIARLQRPGAEDGSHIVFVVRNDASTSKIVFQTSDTTWQAYNLYGGSDFYEGGAHGRAYELSYNRPFATRGNVWGRDFLFSNEYPTIRFMERNGYDVSYMSGVDADVRGQLIKNHKVFLSVGHDEYWSGNQRANVEAARDAGVNLAFLSGNEVYWKTRLEPSRDGANTANRTLVSYKETWANDKIDPSTEWSGTWRDPRFSPPSNGGKPENALTGQQYMANDDDLPLTVPAEQGNMRLWRNTEAAGKSSGSTVLSDHIIGYESDEDVDNGFRPAGTVRLSKTVGATPQYLRDFGNTVSPGTTTHSVTLYKAASGALVFDAGTIQWGWGLDEVHDSQSVPLPADENIQQATVNLFADMGVQPATLMSTLAAANASTDVQAPTATITTPAAGASAVNGNQVTVTGTATDLGGGKVAGVEVSTDGGTTWHPATGTTSWSYTLYAAGLGSQTLVARAADDSANLGGNSAARTLNLTGSNTLYGARVPDNPAETDSGGWELGVKFKPTVDGFITGIRFYKGTGNTGTHTGTLWSSSGSKIVSGTFGSETGSGWQKLTFSTAVPVTAGTTYVASYYAPNGHYAADFFSYYSYRDWVSGPISALRSTQASGNGVFKAGSTGFPNQTYNDTNYYVDVVFNSAESAPPAVAAVSPADGATGVDVAAKPTATFTKAVNSSSIQFTVKDPNGTSVAGATSYDSASKTAKFTPSAALGALTTYTATVKANDSSGTPMDAPSQWSFTTDLAATVQTLLADDAVPTVLSNNDSGSVELGVKFKPSVSGTVVGIRYYQGDGNTGSHTGTLWTSGGTQMAQLTFADSTTVGWKVGMFSSPVPVTAGTTYVVSYHAPNGHYSTNTNFFSSTYTNGPLSATSVNNGLYRYSSGAAFPNNSYNATNYWVDPLFVAGNDPTPPSVSGFFGDEDVPAHESWNDGGALELGVKFSSDTAGKIKGIRFFKGAGNTGTHTGTLWSSTGSVLATGTFQSESDSGWQTLTFTTPVDITAGTTYVATYYAPNGHYAITGGGLTSGWTTLPLHIPSGGAVYRYGGGFPSDGSNTNYWVDVVFEASN
ncbi:DUF4082 domain-containing protein [Actinoplanes sp. NPDC051513]|uniref:DUF4082 domain-containing protein n=1 Tax=Actinoplanes sp. NPDC051513 TaxID=3363908 RepID=UPI00378B281D